MVAALAACGTKAEETFEAKEEIFAVIEAKNCFYDAGFVKNSTDVPRCTCGGIVKPDVVLYEEGLDQTTIEKSVRAIYNADMLIVAGTSLTVYPAAGLINYYQGKRLVLINRDATPYDSRADLVIHDALGNVFSQL